jgi:hypothetical protein
MFAVFLRSDMKKIHWKYYQSLTLLYLKQELPTAVLGEVVWPMSPLLEGSVFLPFVPPFRRSMLIFTVFVSLYMTSCRNASSNLWPSYHTNAIPQPCNTRTNKSHPSLGLLPGIGQCARIFPLTSPGVF